MKQDTNNQSQRNANPRTAKKSNPRHESKGGAARQKKLRKRSRKPAFLPVGILVESGNGDNLLYINDGQENWVLDSEILRVYGPERTKHWKKSIPKFCFSNLVVPKLRGGKAKLKAINLTRLDKYHELKLKSMQSDWGA